MTHITYTQAMEWLPEYVLGTLDSEDMLAVDGYITAHQDMLTWLGQLEGLVARLAYAAPQAPLPPTTKAELLKQVYADVGQFPTIPTRPKAPKKTWDFLQQPRVAWALTAAALLMMVLLGTYTLPLRQEAGQLRAQTIANQVQIAQLQQQHVAQSAILARAQRFTILPGSERAPNARATLYVDGDAGVMVVHGLRQTNASETYQLWLISPNNEPISVGLLAIHSDNPSIMTIDVPPSLHDFSAVGISLEPSGGSPQPTDIVLLGSGG